MLPCLTLVGVAVFISAAPARAQIVVRAPFVDVRVGPGVYVRAPFVTVNVGGPVMRARKSPRRRPRVSRRRLVFKYGNMRIAVPLPRGRPSPER
jgi:hypothetical protein